MKHLKRIKKARTSAVINLVIFSSFLMITLILLRKIITSPGLIGLVNDWLIPPFSEQFKQLLELNWYAWYPYMDFGLRGGALSSILFYRVFLNFLASLGLSGYTISKIVITFSPALAGFFMFYLCRQMKIGTFPSMMSGFFYMTTPMVFDYLIGGIEFSVLIYALRPLTLTFFMKSLEEGNYRNVIATGILVGFVSGVTHIFIVGVMLLLFCLVYSAHKKHEHSFLSSLKILGIIFCISFLIGSFWILPLANEAIAGQMYGRWEAVRPIPMEHYLFMEQYAQPTNIVRLIGSPLGYFLRTASVGTFWLTLSFIPVFLGFMAFLLRPRDKKVMFFGLLAVVGIVLACGTKGPLNGIWLWALKETPLRIFRESYKWIALACLGYAGLLGTTMEVFLGFIRKKFALGLKKKDIFSTSYPPKIKVPSSFLIVLLFGIIIGGSVWPFFTGDFGGNMKTQNLDSYEEIWRWLSDCPEDFRVLALPAPTPTLYPGQKYAGEDIMAHFMGKPVIYSGEPQHPQFTRFLFKTLYENRTRHLSELLGLANVKYAIFDTNKTTTKTAWWIPQKYYPSELFTNEKIINTLTQQENMKLVRSDDSIITFNNTDYLPHIFPVNQISLIAGDLSSLVSISYTENLKLEDLGLVYVNQLSAEDIAILSNLPNVRIIVQDDYFFELVLSAVPKEYVLSPSEYAVARSPSEGWYPYVDWYWYNWDYAAELNQPAFTFVESDLTIPYSLKQSGNFNIYLKTYFGPRASRIMFDNDGSKIGEVITNTLNDLGFKWVNLGSAHLNQGDHLLRIKSEKGENVVANIAVVPKDVMEEASETVNNLIQNRQVILISELEKWQVSQDTAWIQRGSDLSRWQVSSDTMKWLESKMVENDTFILTAHFYGNETVAENVAMYSDIKPIDLKNYRYFELYYKFQDSQVQTIAVDLYIDFTGDYVADKIAYGWSPRPLYQIPAPKEYSYYRFNMLEEVKQRFPDKEVYNLVGMRLHNKKLHVMADGNYSFFVKHIQIYDLPWFPSELGVNASQGFVMSTKYNVSISRPLYVPKQGFYEIYLRVASKTLNSTLTLQISSAEFEASLSPISDGFEWYKVGETMLSEGFNEIVLDPDGRDEIFIDQLLIMQSLDSPITLPITVSLTSEMVNPTKYLIQAEASQPFYVVFSEAYDNSWRVYTEDESIEGYPVYSFGNLFFINKTGSIQMVLEYERQKLYDVGKYISFSSFAFLLLLLVIPSRLIRPLSKRIISKVKRKGVTN